MFYGAAAVFFCWETLFVCVFVFCCITIVISRLHKNVSYLLFVSSQQHKVLRVSFLTYKMLSAVATGVHVRGKRRTILLGEEIRGVESESLDSSLFIVAGLSDQLAEWSNEKQMDGSLCVCASV